MGPGIILMPARGCFLWLIEKSRTADQADGSYDIHITWPAAGSGVQQQISCHLLQLIICHYFFLQQIVAFCGQMDLIELYTSRVAISHNRRYSFYLCICYLFSFLVCKQCIHVMLVGFMPIVCVSNSRGFRGSGTRNSLKHFAHPSTNSTGVNKCEIWSQFSIPHAFQSLSCKKRSYISEI